MKCKKCGKNIDEYEIYCNDCNELLKKENEYNKLVEKNKELNKFEITKEVETLNNFKDENKADEFSLKEELKDIVNIEEIESDLVKNNVKTIIIVLITITLFLILIFTLVFILFKNKKVEPIEEEINYEKIINDYGKLLSESVLNYIDTNKELPSWSLINDLVKYEDHDIVCKIHSIYEDGKIYLSDCEVDDNKIEYSYGKYQEEKKEGKKIEIFKKQQNDNYYIYSDVNDDNLEPVGVITCKTDLCEYINAYDKYVLIKENNEYYLYNYDTSNVEFGPFNIDEENSVLVYENKLYGIIYKNDDKLNIYNTTTGKTLKNLTGELIMPLPHFETNIMYKYGYVILKDDNKNNFVNLKTGNISYTITGVINNFIEDDSNNIVYITTLNSNNSKITIYNSNGKQLFSGKEYSDIILHEGKIIVSNNTNFYVYNSKLMLETTSKNYNILDLYKGFVFVVDEEYLNIVDFDDNLLAVFDLKWDSDNYSLDTKLSGWLSDTEIKLIVNEKDSNKFLECYYNIQTNETKVTELNI